MGDLVTDVRSFDGTRLAVTVEGPAGSPTVVLVDVPGAGHRLPLTHGPLVAEHVTRWVTRTTPVVAAVSPPAATPSPPS